MKSSLSLPSQLLLRDIATIEGSNVLVIGAPEAEIGTHLRKRLPKAALTFFNFDLGESRRHRGLYGSWYKAKKLHDTAIIYLPKSEWLIRMVFAMVRAAVQSSATIFIVGQKNAGIKSQEENITEFLGTITSSDAARHSTIYEVTVTQSLPKANSLKKWAEEYTFELGKEFYKGVSVPGVFSFGKLDEGTRLLLESLGDTLDTFPSGARVLDWGCGSGVIGMVIKKKYPNLTVDMVDSNALALDAAIMTLTANSVSANVFATDIFSDVKNKYDLIVSNPPFHRGMETNYAVVEDFISQAKDHLRVKGQLRIVANSFLRYRPLILKAFGNCEIIGETSAYKIYEARRSAH